MYHDTNSRWFSIPIAKKLQLLIANDRKANPTGKGKKVIYCLVGL